MLVSKAKYMHGYQTNININLLISYIGENNIHNSSKNIQQLTQTMRIELLPLALLSSFLYCFTEALVISSFLGPRGILKARGASHASSLISSSTTLFFKNATRSNFDVDRDSNPLTQSDSSNSTAAAIKIVKPFVENDDSTSDLNFAPFEVSC